MEWWEERDRSGQLTYKIGELENEETHVTTICCRQIPFCAE